MSSKPDWYEKGSIYKKDLSLSEWGNELQWRYELFTQINEAKLPKLDCYCINSHKELRKIYGKERRDKVIKDGIYCNYVVKDRILGDSGDEKFNNIREQLKRSFLCCVANSNDCDQQQELGKRIGEPLRGVSSWGLGLHSELRSFFSNPNYSTKDYEAIDNMTHEEGLIFPLVVNLSYDKETLVNRFKEVLDNYNHALESGKLIPNGSTTKDKGLKSYTEKDAQIWNKQKILHYIDINILWRNIVGNCLGKYPNKELLKFFWEGEGVEHDEAYISGTVAPNAKKLLNSIVISRIKASAKLPYIEKHI